MVGDVAEDRFGIVKSVEFVRVLLHHQDVLYSLNDRVDQIKSKAANINDAVDDGNDVIDEVPPHADRLEH